MNVPVFRFESLNFSRVSVPWTATVIKGGLHWNQNISRFLLPDPDQKLDAAQANCIAFHICALSNRTQVLVKSSHRIGHNLFALEFAKGDWE
jgi:hypothetical protein